MLPGSNTIKESPREPIKRDFYDMDSLLAELSVPKEQIQRNTPGPGSTSSATGGASPQPGQSSGRIYTADQVGEPVEPEPMTPEVAAMSGKMIANTIDTAVGTGLSLYAKNTNPEKYQATDKQLSNLERAWAAVAAKYNYHVEDSPWFNALIQTGAVYIPHFQEAKNDRRFAQVNEQMEEIKAEMKKQAAALEAMKAAQQPTPSA